MAAKIISFVNLKGGVGKTALTVNVGVSLAAEYGKKVLVVDLDPQSNASLWLMGLQDWVSRANHHRTKTVYGLLCHNQPISECLVKSPVKNEHGGIEAEKLDLIPATYHLMFFEENYRVPEGQPASYVRFYRHIKTLRDIYDYILVDCPPNIYKATKCAIFSADRILVPCNPDALSWMGLDLLAKRIHSFAQRTAAELDQERPGEAVPLVAGIIMNDVQAVARIPNRLADTHLTKRLATLKNGGHTTADAKIFPIKIRDAAAFKTGTFQFRPLLFADTGNGNLLEDYRGLAQYFITNF